jgi:RNA polymerase primary sigma factor
LELLEDENVETPVDAAARSMARRRVVELLGCLGQRERDVILRRYGLHDGRVHTLEEVASHFEITRERVRQIEQKSIKRLKEPEVAAELKELLE